MSVWSKQKTLGITLLTLLVSLACNLPYGLDLSKDKAPGGGTEIGQVTEIAPTATPTATYLPTFTATTTPEPTSTATLVVPFTATPTPRVKGTAGTGAGGAATSPAEGTAAPVLGEPAPSGKVAAPAPPRPAANTANVIYNGDFEAKWPAWQPVAPGWSSFDNGQAHVSFYNDTWFKAVYQGQQAQLIEMINDQGELHRHGGIYQTVNVVPGAEYELTIHGLVRSDEGDEEESEHGYAMEYAIDYYGGDDWQAMLDWIVLPFPEYPRQDTHGQNTYTYGVYTTRIIPPSNKLTLFIGGWKKWADYNEGNFDVDAVSLRGTGKRPTFSPTPAPIPIVSVPTSVPRCTPYQWTDCGGTSPDKVCPAEHVSQCRSDGTWGECVWDPGFCGPTPTPTPTPKK